MSGSRKSASTSSFPGSRRRPKAQPAKRPITVLIATAMTPMTTVFWSTSGMLPTSIAHRYHSSVSWGGSQSFPNHPFPTERSAIIRNGATMNSVRLSRIV